jgi:hypothetical protein
MIYYVFSNSFILCTVCFMMIMYTRTVQDKNNYIITIVTNDGYNLFRLVIWQPANGRPTLDLGEKVYPRLPKEWGSLTSPHTVFCFYKTYCIVYNHITLLLTHFNHLVCIWICTLSIETSSLSMSLRT